ncbi:hypothetical protein HK097_009147 [Rhizophlyctis rosea]|uniref:GDP-mannose transporter n=1 Tax=Rhizophlyctis rosea TaxID=64517 RepID=A0AAD5SCE5_9FUNG|nr:hypothetical protein HK097_009147 [Rhizophlyctis rosea]
MCHQLTGAFVTRVGTQLGYKKASPHLDQKWVLAISAGIGLSIVLSNWALALLSVGTCQLMKLLCTPTIALLQYCLYGRKLPVAICTMLTILLLGVGLAAIDQVALNFLVIIVLVLATLSAAASQVLLQRFNEVSNVPLRGLDILEVTSPYIAAITTISFTILELVRPSSMLDGDMWSATPLIVLAMSCIAAVAVSIYGYALLIKSSAVTFQVVGNLKTVLILLVAWGSGDTVLTLQQAVGIVLALGAGVGYSYMKLRSAEAKPQVDREQRLPLCGDENSSDEKLLKGKG